MLGVEDPFTGDQAEQRHQARGDEDRLDLVRPLGGQEPKCDNENGDCEHRGDYCAC